MEIRDNFDYDNLRVDTIFCLKQGIRNRKFTLKELKDRCRQNLQGRQNIRTVEQFVDALEEQGIIGNNKVEFIRMLAEEIDLQELIDKVDKYELKRSGLIMKMVYAAKKTPVIVWQVCRDSANYVLISVRAVLSTPMVRDLLVQVLLRRVLEDDPQRVQDFIRIRDANFRLAGVGDGSVVFVLKITSVSSITQLWQSYKDGSLKYDMIKAFNKMEELKELSKGEEIDVEVTIDEDEYREVYWNLIHSEMKANDARENVRKQPSLISRRHSVGCQQDVSQLAASSNRQGVSQLHIQPWRHVDELNKVLNNFKSIKAKIEASKNTAIELKEVVSMVEQEEKRLSEMRQELSELDIVIDATGFEKVKVKEKAGSTVIHDKVQRIDTGAYLKGTYPEETVHLTKAMVNSGETLRWPAEWGSCIGDKLSTGGVGDKVSLALAPALAACEVKVPMISGRSLGHTGGTLDKLESIPGFKINLSPDEMKDVLENVGCCIVGQTASLVPADKALYAIRDVTATVASVPLIASSIISKKIAESLTALVIDVKCGRGALASTKESARYLARTLADTCEGLGTRCTALITNMDHPIGKTVGNSVEVAEAIQCLHGQGPEDLEELVCILGGHLLKSLDKVDIAEEGMEFIKHTLTNGMAIKKFSQMLVAQGVSQEIADDLCRPGANPYQHIPLANKTYEVKAQKSGIIKDIDALECANLCSALGAGRQKSTDNIDHGVGMVLSVRVGEYIKEGEPWTVICHRGKLTTQQVELLQEAIVIEESEDEESLPIQSRLIEVINSREQREIFVCQ